MKGEAGDKDEVACLERAEVVREGTDVSIFTYSRMRYVVMQVRRGQGGGWGGCNLQRCLEKRYRGLGRGRGVSGYHNGARAVRARASVLRQRQAWVPRGEVMLNVWWARGGECWARLDARMGLVLGAAAPLSCCLPCWWCC